MKLSELPVGTVVGYAYSRHVREWPDDWAGLKGPCVVVGHERIEPTNRWEKARTLVELRPLEGDETTATILTIGAKVGPWKDCQEADRVLTEKRGRRNLATTVTDEAIERLDKLGHGLIGEAVSRRVRSHLHSSQEDRLQAAIELANAAGRLATELEKGRQAGIGVVNNG